MSVTNKNAVSPLMVIIAFATVYIVWGSTYFFIQIAIEDFPPFLLGAMRFVAAGAIMLGWSVIRKERIFVVKDIRHATVSGLLMLFIGTGAVIWVEQYLPSAMVAIMISSGPLWFILLDKPKWRENFTNKATIIGLLIGFAGVILLFSEKIFSSSATGTQPAELSSILILLIGSMTWAAGSLFSKYKTPEISVAANTGWQMLAAGIAFIPGSILRGELAQVQWQHISTAAWGSVLYLIFLGSIAGFSAYVWLLKVRSATQVSTHAYVNPVVAVLLGVFFASENISIWQIAGLVVILGSVLLINVVKSRSKITTASKQDDPAIQTRKGSSIKVVKQSSATRSEKMREL